MSAPKVFFVVGHEHWGKSHTLRELTAESVRRTQVQVGEHLFEIHHSSSESRHVEVRGTTNRISHRLMSMLIQRRSTNPSSPAWNS